MVLLSLVAFLLGLELLGLELVLGLELLSLELLGRLDRSC